MIAPPPTPELPTSWRRRPRQQRSQVTVNAILEAAEQLFSAKGFANTTAEEIARRAGTGIGSLYDYFSNKASIALALLEVRSGALADEARSMFMTHSVEPLEESLPRVISGLFDSYRQNQDIFINLVNDVPALRAAAEIYSIDRLIHRASLIYLRNYEDELGRERIDSLHDFLMLVFLGSIRQFLSGVSSTLSDQQFEQNLSAILLLYLRTPHPALHKPE